MIIAQEQDSKMRHKGFKVKDLSDMLANQFTEAELQMMFSDLRFFFPDEKIYFKLLIFHELDIFENEHLRIKESYFERMA